MSAFLFIPLLALTWAFGFALISVAAHYFLVVFEGSAAGNEEVVLPEEPFTDWFWKGFYLAFIGIIWGAPGFFFAWAVGGTAPVQTALLIGWFWLLFPIGILSSTSASSRWVPLWFGLFGRMSQRLNKVGAFYVISMPVVTLLGTSFYFLAVRKDTDIPLVFILAPIVAASFLVYARLLGRIGLVLTFTKETKPASKAVAEKKRPRPQRATMPVPLMEELPAGPKQPSEMPGLMTPMDGEITGYKVPLDDKAPTPDPPKTPRPRWYVADDAATVGI